ncbi:MAG: restriction endonuclease subunit S [Erysipelotrichaceae bacterium]|nr:restriction endonuclease subunit S [Erysipelotrichaceae bacterium]
MTEKEKRMPMLRFPGFTNPWEQRKWSDVVDISTEMVNPTSGEFDNMPHIAPGNIESFTGRILDNVKTVKEEQLISGKFRFRPNDVVYGKINPQLGKYFFARTDGLTSADAYVLNGKNGLTQKFLYSVLQTEDFFKYSVSVSKRSGMPKINRDELNAYSFFAPSEDEQERIGGFLLDIDNLITLHHRKCNELKELKKGLLQQMFPKKEECVPRIRFPGFTDPWEQRKLCEVAQITMGQSPDGSTYSDTPSTYILVQGNADLKDGWVSPRIWTTQKTKTAEAGDLIMSVRAPAGAMGKTAYDVVLGRGVAGIKGNEFLFQTLVKMDGNGYWKKFAAGSTFESINSDAVNNAVIMIPKDEEQAKIGAFFDDLDRTIALHHRKCNELKELKKGLLQQMFV